MTDAPSVPPILDDLPTGQDRLDFGPYVDALADILLDPVTHTPLTLGVFGPWGSGKTSLMTMLRDRVAGGEGATATPRHRTTWFNAWKYNHEDALWRALLLLLLDDLERLLRADPPPPVEGEPKPEELLERLRQALYRETSWTEKGALQPDILRGGSFYDDPGFVRCASRGWDNPDGRSGNYGFRVARGSLK